MHQQARHPPRISSPASSPQTNPTRTNNQRDALGAAAVGRGVRPGSEAVGAGGREGVGGGAPVPHGGYGGLGEGAAPEPRPPKESVRKLDQIIQNFFLKAAVLVVQSRIDVTPIGGREPEHRKINRWFQIDTDEIENFKDELRIWKSAGSFDNHPPPMIIETYIDASRLSSNQSLVVLDENGRRWDVLEALNSSESSSNSNGSNGSSRRDNNNNTEIVLERWRFELRCLPTDDDAEDFGPNLPTVYKRSIVFFRSLFVTTHIMPGWKFSQHAVVKGPHPALEIKCRILTAEPEHTRVDPLRQPLFDGSDVVTDYMFGDLEVPVGRFYASVSFRNNCSFRVEDSDSLLGSRFMGVDENFFKPSIQTRREHRRTDSLTDLGSLQSQRLGRERGAQEPQQTYGSLNTFHGAGALGTSPMTALKAIRPAGSDTSSPPGSIPASVEPDPPHSLPIRAQQPLSGSRASLRNLEILGRRPSVSFQPFKAGSLSGSPRVPEPEPSQSPQSYTRPSGPSSLSSHTRNRSSLTVGMAASLRGAPAAVAETPPVVGSPKQTSRYSSSFTHRRGRPSFGGQSKGGDDDAGSSGRQSLSSSAQPGSGLLAEAGGGASSGSVPTDDDNISDFLKALDSRKTLQSFEPNKAGETSAAKKTAAQLSKFHLMRESNNALTESMTSSMHLQRSSSTSSRHLANVPSMVNPASMSSASSPGKPLSPHTPHTPAIPSRLSENSIIDYHGQGVQATQRPTRDPEMLVPEEETTEDAPVSQDGTSAIDIPLSPRLLISGNSSNRRASSLAQQHRVLRGDDEVEDLAQRSLSLGANDRETPSLNTLGIQRVSDGGAVNSSDSPTTLQPAPEIRSSALHPSPPPAECRRDDKTTTTSGGVLPGAEYRLRYQGRVNRGTPPHSSRGSFSSGRFVGSLGRGSGGGEDGADDEPLVFAMSELERDSRRSLEEGRRSAGGSVGSGSAEGYEQPRGVTRRGWP